MLGVKDKTCFIVMAGRPRSPVSRRSKFMTCTQKGKKNPKQFEKTILL